MTSDAFLQLLDGTRHTSRGWRARCPAHDGKSLSLSIREAEDGRILVRCFAGCGVHEICAALGIKVRDLYPNSHRDSHDIRAAQQQRQRRNQVKQQVQQLRGAQAVIQREAEAVIRTSSPIELGQLSDDQLDTFLNAIGEAHTVLCLDMGGEQEYAEWSCCLGRDHRAVAND